MSTIHGMFILFTRYYMVSYLVLFLLLFLFFYEEREGEKRKEVAYSGLF